MGSTKKEQYSEKQLHYAQTAKAIAHPARIAIVQFLSANGFGNNQHFMEITSLSDATVCFHLKELTNSGLISERFFRNDHVYFLTSNAAKDILALEQITSGL